MIVEQAVARALEKALPGLIEALRRGGVDEEVRAA
jgi:hypothetical protein